MSEWVIVAVVGVILLFSAKKLPDMARGLGQSMRIFKTETRGLKEDEERAKDAKPGEVAPGRAVTEAERTTTSTDAPEKAKDTTPGA